MTKETLFKQTITYSGYEFVRLEALNEFLSQNVCIPKGENRHPYADELHAYAEGIEVEVNINTELQPKWYKFALGHKYRIKSSEPVYEWQWMINNQIEFIEYKTEDEISEYFNGTDDFERIIKTKRERK